ncbi:sugar ABC transporter ATP-binding protein [Laceyella putida]|uniref:Autoinducer 2 import ATP-binding protein LsrA n=1 Tax=Laceyella putida TaxID=110101 RepID=A0ABW2RLS7_9BACL
MTALTLKQISKSFHNHPVLHQVDFSVQPGEVHALIGVNGAGKSTLVKILSGDIQKDHGSIRLGERDLDIRSPMDAKREGISIVVQEVDTALIPTLSVAENVTIDECLHGPSFFSWKKRKQTARTLLSEVGIHLAVDKLVSSCTLAEKQMILIARAIAGQVKFLILDEPTAPLSEVETATLFQVIRRLTDRGVGIVYISHRLNEIKTISDRLTILRDGKVITTQNTSEMEHEEMIRAMLGKTFSPSSATPHKKLGKPLAEINQFHVHSTGQTLSLTVYEGEIVGIAGLVGAGKTETARALFGADPHDGTWTIKGTSHPIQNPQQAIRAGICLIPEERRKEGVLVDFPVVQNLTLPSIRKLSPKGWINRRKEILFAEGLIERLGIKTPSPFHSVRRLSGGNQQKVSIGKWLDTHSHLVIFDEPTKGIDIGAKEDVFQLIRELARQGKGIIYFTSEFSELLTIADRILVMDHGQFVSEWKNEEATMEKLMHAATGGYYGTSAQ